jgi:site-specific recombinase XerD
MTSPQTGLIPAVVLPVEPHSQVDEQAREFARRSRSENTLRAYDADWRHFTAWCSNRACSCLPAAPQTVARYLAALADDHKASTIQRRLSAISQVHQLRGFESPTKCEPVRSVLKGIRRTLGTAPRQKTPLVANDVREMVARLPDSLLGVRDCALLLLGFAGAFRRSELVSLNVDDLTFTPDGLIIMLRRSKSDQEGQGRKIGIPRLTASDACPVRAIQDWLEASGIADGPVFRPVGVGDRLCLTRLSPRAVALVIKRTVAKGQDANQFAGHSLRAGFVTSASNGGANIHAIMKQTGHRSLEMVLRYVREASLFRGNAVASTGL